VDKGAERGGGRVEGQPGAVGTLEFHPQVAVARERGGQERDCNKTRRRRGCAERGLGRETAAQLRDLDPELLGHPRRWQHGCERQRLRPQGLGNVGPRLGAALPPVRKLSRSLIELVFSL
jgi:hypothetical protein